MPRLDALPPGRDFTDRVTRVSAMQPNSSSTPPLLIASYILTGVALCGVLTLHLLPAMFAGLLVFSLINSLAPGMQRHLPGTRAHWFVVALLAVIVVGTLTLAIAAAIAFINSERGNPAELFERATLLIERARGQLPNIIVDHLPDDSADIRASAIEWLRLHAAQLRLAGETTARVIVQLFVGIVLGAMLALYRARPRPEGKPLTQVLGARCGNLLASFRDVVFAQTQISGLNTLFTGIFLLIVLPLLGVHLPLAKTLVIATFIVGLLPVVGNLISNTLIVVVALSVSVWVAVAALGFLIVIHKLEYFLNARIVGTRIRAHAWELLIAMLVMEATFGLAGLVAAPIYYAYLKNELSAARLI